MTEAQVDELVQLALATFGDMWQEDNVTYSWLHANWSETRDRPRPSVWRKQIKQLKVDVLTTLMVLRQPAVSNASERQRSRSPHGDNRSQQWTTPQTGKLLRVGGKCKTDIHLRKQAIVDRLMSKTIVKFPDILETSETTHGPFDTQDLWIHHLHSRHCTREIFVCQPKPQSKPPKKYNNAFRKNLNPLLTLKIELSGTITVTNR